LRRTLLDNGLEAEFRTAGFVVVRLLDDATIIALSGAYETLNCTLARGWHADLFSDDLAYRSRVYEQVGPLLAPPVRDLLDRHRMVSLNFVVKEAASETSRVQIHQDWTVVDHSRFESANVFCPLIDTTVDNGWLVVVPGSHRPPCRISFAPHDQLRFEGSWDDMVRYMRPLPLKAGEAVIYNGRLLHGSPPNRTHQRRIALSAGFIPNEAAMRLYFSNSAHPDRLELLELPDEFFLTYRLGTRPTTAVSCGFIPLHNPPLTAAQLEAWAASAQ